MVERKRIWRASPEVEAAAREMRKNPTPDEAELWKYLRNGWTKYKFRRQHAIGRFILDFYCAEKRLCVEVDGPIHEHQRERDAERDAFLASSGIRVLRITNREVQGQMEATLGRIKEALHAARPARDPLPQAVLGEGDASRSDAGGGGLC